MRNDKNIITDYDLRYECEEHPYNASQDELLKGAEILIVGTFPPSRFVSKKFDSGDVDWYYGSKDNEMWGVNGEGGLLQKVLEPDSNEVLGSVEARQNFCKKHKIAFLDLFQEINRYANSALDENIFPLKVLNLLEYLKHSRIKAVFFTSEWVMKVAKKEYLKQNQKYLKELYKRKNGKEKKEDFDYVANSCFYLEARDILGETMDKQEGVKLIRLSSPSPYSKEGFSKKLEQWEKAFEEGGLIKSNNP